MPLALVFLLIGLVAVVAFEGRAEAKESPDTLDADYRRALTENDYLLALRVAERLEAAGQLVRALELRRFALRLIGASEGSADSPTFWLDALNILPLFLQENLLRRLDEGTSGGIRAVAAQILNNIPAGAPPSTVQQYQDIASTLRNLADILAENEPIIGPTVPLNTSGVVRQPPRWLYH